MAVDAVLVGARGTSSGSNANVATTGGAVSAGDGLAAFVSFDPGVTVTSITDTAGNSYGAAKASLTGQGKLALYTVDNAAANASNVLTINFSGPAFATAHLIKITGASAAAYDSASLASSAADAASPWTLASGTLSQADEVILAALEANASGGPAINGDYASSNYTLLSSEPNLTLFWTSGVTKLVVSSTSPSTPSMTRSGSADAAGAMIVAGFKMAGVVTGQPAARRFGLTGVIEIGRECGVTLFRNRGLLVPAWAA